MTLTVRTGDGGGDLLPAVIDSELRWSAERDGKVELTVSLIDADGDRAASPLLQPDAWLELAGVPLVLRNVRRQGRRRELRTIWQDATSLELSRVSESEVTAPDTSTVDRWVRQVVREVSLPDGSTPSAIVEDGSRLADDEDQDQLFRGGDDDEGRDETSWDALGRLGDACDPPRQRFSTGVAVVFASVGWLADGQLEGAAPFEWDDTVADRVDWEWDVGEPADSAVVHVWVDRLDAVRAGVPVRLRVPGPASDGVWLAEQVTVEQPLAKPPFETKVALTRPEGLR